MIEMFDRAEPLIKTCGMIREADIDAVNEARPDMCGFIINYPKSHRSISPERAEQLANMLHDSIYPVGVFVDEPVDNIVEMVDRGTITIVQLHGSEDESYIEDLRSKADPSAIIKAFKVNTEEDVIRACTNSADIVLLDSGKGSGQTFDWSLCKAATRPFILAGGLGPNNVALAIEQVRPWAVDMSSGLETEKLKDKAKIIEATKIVKEQR